jgi:hypothetical protein
MEFTDLIITLYLTLVAGSIILPEGELNHG